MDNVTRPSCRENAIPWMPRAGMACGSGNADLRSAQPPAGPRAVHCRPPSRGAGTGPAARGTVSATPTYGSRGTLGFPPRRDHLGAGVLPAARLRRAVPTRGRRSRAAATTLHFRRSASAPFQARRGVQEDPIMGVSPGGGSSLRRFVSRTPTGRTGPPRSLRSRHVVHRLSTPQRRGIGRVLVPERDRDRITR